MRAKQHTTPCRTDTDWQKHDAGLNKWREGTRQLSLIISFRLFTIRQLVSESSVHFKPQLISKLNRCIFKSFPCVIIVRTACISADLQYSEVKLLEARKTNVFSLSLKVSAHTYGLSSADKYSFTVLYLFFVLRRHMNIKEHLRRRSVPWVIISSTSQSSQSSVGWAEQRVTDSNQRWSGRTVSRLTVLSVVATCFFCL